MAYKSSSAGASTATAGIGICRIVPHLHLARFPAISARILCSNEHDGQTSTLVSVPAAIKTPCWKCRDYFTAPRVTDNRNDHRIFRARVFFLAFVILHHKGRPCPLTFGRFAPVTKLGL